MIAGCKTVSTPPSIKPTTPEVRCKQPATPPISKAPAADRWIEVKGASAAGDAYARLSEEAANWITELLGTLTKERKLRKVEHECLDTAEKRGLIQQ